MDIHTCIDTGKFDVADRESIFLRLRPLNSLPRMVFFFFFCVRSFDGSGIIHPNPSCSFPLIPSSLQGIQRTLTWAWISKTVAGRDSRTRELLRMRKQETSFHSFRSSDAACTGTSYSRYICARFFSLCLCIYTCTRQS